MPAGAGKGAGRHVAERVLPGRGWPASPWPGVAASLTHRLAVPLWLQPSEAGRRGESSPPACCAPSDYSARSNSAGRFLALARFGQNPTALATTNTVGIRMRATDSGI